MKYRYYINGVEVFPKGEWSIEYQRNEGQIFFRRIFEGELTFSGDDYDFIKGFSCEIATFDIYCGGAIHWQGQFQYPYLVKFDDDSCVVVLTPEVVDEYSCIMNNYDTEYTASPSITFGVPITANLYTCVGALRVIMGAANPLLGYLDTIINHATYGMECGLTIKSSFMERDNFPNGDNYAAAYGTNNYITGAANRLEQIYLMKNGVARQAFGGTNVGGITKVTFKDFETLLRNAFNAYWFIDENGDLRIEHIHYFDPDFAHSDYVVGRDLNTVMDRSGRSFAYRRNKYEYETGRMYDQEKWTWQHYEGTEGSATHGSDFEGVPIFYGAAEGDKSVYVPGVFKEREFACPKFWTDVEWGWDIATNPPNATPGSGEPDTISEFGFLMLDVHITTNYIRCEVGILSTINIANGHLSTANLQDHYHQYDRIFLSGDMNSGDVTTFQTAQKHKLQEPIEFPLCCDEDFDPLNRIRTGLGDGEVKAAVQKKQSMEVELWHEFDC